MTSSNWNTSWPFVRGIHWSPVDSPHKGQWRGALLLSLICAWTNGWANNRDAGDLRRHGARYGAMVMVLELHTGDGSRRGRQRVLKARSAGQCNQCLAGVRILVTCLVGHTWLRQRYQRGNLPSVVERPWLLMQAPLDCLTQQSQSCNMYKSVTTRPLGGCPRGASVIRYSIKFRLLFRIQWKYMYSINTVKREITQFIRKN